MKKNILFYLILLFPLTSFAQTNNGWDAVDVFLALAQAFPNYVKIVPNRNNSRQEPAILVRGRLFYWVEGRILPEEAISGWEKYATNGFYFYAKKPPDPASYSPELIAYLKSTANKRRNKRPSPHPDFSKTLYNIKSASDAASNLVKMRFFKRQVVIHQMASEPLRRVEQEILALAQSDAEVRVFVQQIDTVYSFIWRKISGTQIPSTHSFGLSIDIINSKNKKPVYWLWQKVLSDRWISDPVSRRWAPPDKVIKIFEKNGFAWGGKWYFYDTIHLEYRPEILLLNGYKVNL